MRKGLQNSIQHLNQLAYSARAYRSFHYDSMKQQGVLQLPLDGMQVHSKVTPNISSGFPDS